MPRPAIPPVTIATPEVRALRADLEAAPFTLASALDVWGDAAGQALHRGNRIPARRAVEAARTADGLPAAAVLAALFVLGDPVDVADLSAALPSLGLDGARRLGLVEVDGDLDVHPAVDLRPYGFIDAHGVGEWWIASDLGERATGGALDEDHVLGVGGASATLSGLMISTPVASALDLGTGCGIQALHASRHADRVVATDISARALAFAALNAALNGITTIELRLGSLFEPVAGERFDHIVSNPPFVITPRAEGVPAYEYRDAGLVGDALVEGVVADLADHLTPGGVAQLLGNWEHRAGEPGLERVAGWLDRAAARTGSGLDAWIVEREVQDAALYAETWIRDGGTRAGTPESEALMGAWLDDFAARGVDGVGFGYLTLRRPAVGAPTLRRIERLHSGLGHNPTGLGDHLQASLAAHDALAGVDDRALAGLALVLAGDVTEERHYWPGAEDPTVMTLRQGAGFGREVPLDTGLAALVGACDGELAVGAIVDAVAQLTAVDADALRAELLPRIRGLVADGFLLLPGATTGDAHADRPGRDA
ncbi:DUF7059 domain-containing protein [Clavibacter michiganensis]|uniref:DUF7059 domain-containing protein n=2 Tax=Clavibacter michiganensis TaxID=28447 RepID=UPI000B8E8FC6|nr:methyltransferase [Clavibacter michiganensis]OQJ59192.1 SAM-dependent methyltransferase [Clavibacter michiganensis subsp. insidiosus]RMC83872.1 methyltransferase domain-containing protein [Clavibacter michiganensis subsp. insidiosus]